MINEGNWQIFYNASNQNDSLSIPLNSPIESILVKVSLSTPQPTWRRAGWLNQYWEDEGDLWLLKTAQIQLNGHLVNLSLTNKSLLVFNPVTWLVKSNGVSFGTSTLLGNNLSVNNWNIGAADCTSGVSATQRHWGNGNNFVSVSASNDPSVLGNTLVVGAQSFGTLFNGKLDQVLIIPALLSNPDRQKLEGFLAWQRVAWNLPANLPSNHPFKNRAPYVGD
ncbi:hypothetical protein MiAbW_03133 [Microcystis aeruginosa NIES-4325]|uniref:Uncharacterized protein n=1 Tax=Microcystis aeruginosa NIES-4325 TaxID=2569534 RepID=A0A5J4FC17_MICAE|nr:hypothetical protein [Microcystis aeruginosa]GEA28557.1 hypothetical protein MiAbW_03133 [Microcystis aeruginosa NIES-4325]